MAFRRVDQESDLGCFVAAVASLNDITYREAFNLIHPGSFMTPYNGGLPLSEAPKVLKKLGWKLKKIPIKYLSSLKKDAIIFLTWKDEPEMSHTILYDAESKKIIDPVYTPHLRMRTYERHLNSVYYIEKDKNHERAGQKAGRVRGSAFGRGGS